MNKRDFNSWLAEIEANCKALREQQEDGELEEMIKETRMKRLSREYPKVGGVRDW